ncbi:outer membrane beta-barrel protein [Terrimonas pollutisoli]|uniref:outer membrane beta-barrel protein n=1 Tax=Terrimonas pollutisoli TaxID=3034147 RepID=UPI0023EB34F8|nr:outer membrane beta-barrel protein [Terrimonas sp. H1YJ31]
MRKALTLIVIHFLCLSIHAQVKTGSINGIAKDSLDQPIAFATVTLAYLQNPQTFLQTTYSNEKGHFNFSKVDTGSYLLQITHTGFAAKQQQVTITVSQQIELGIVVLARKGTELKAVTIESKKPLVEVEEDKVIFNVENDPLAKTESAMDILRKTPFVTVDGSDNIAVNGQSSFKVLLNGRETSMFARNVKDALKGFPGSLIVKIEVITSPSAKYDGEGVGGIINIITKKKTKGYNGSLTANYTTNQEYYHSGNLSVKLGKWGLSLSHYLNNGDKVPSSSYSQTTPFITSVYSRRTLAGKTIVNSYGTSENAELVFEADSVNTFSLYAGRYNSDNKTFSNTYITTEFLADPPITANLNETNHTVYPGENIGLDFISKGRRNKEKEFSIRLSADRGEDGSIMNSVQDSYSGKRYIINNNDADNEQFIAQMDYILPFRNNHRLEAGTKLIMRRASSDFKSLVKYDAAAEYEPLPRNTDYFNYEQDVYSAYSIYNLKTKKSSYKFGLRVEKTLVHGDFVTSKTTVKQDYISFLPNVQFSWKLSKAYSLALSYSKRLQRPYIWNLNPFINTNDSLNISYGNPELDPQTSHSVSMQNRFQMGSTFLGITFTGSYSNNSIVYYSFFDVATGVTVNTNANLGEDKRVAMNANLNTRFNPKWSFSLNTNLTYNRARNKYATRPPNEGFSGYATMNTSYAFSKRFLMSGWVSYWRPSVSFQSVRNSNVWYNTGLTYKMMKEKLSLTVSALNFFEKEKIFTNQVNEDLFWKKSKSIYPGQVFTFGFTFNFGKLKERVSKKKGVSNDDLIGKEAN